MTAVVRPPAMMLGENVSPYLTVDELRDFVSSTLSDASLQLLLDAAYDEIEDAAPSAEVAELIGPVRGDLIMLGRAAASVEHVYENDVEIAADDYELRPSGTTLRRLSTGTNPAYAWRGRVDVRYLPDVDTTVRKRVQLELVKLDLASNPTLASQTIGTWKEDYVTKPYADQRGDILAVLTGGTALVV